MNRRTVDRIKKELESMFLQSSFERIIRIFIREIKKTPKKKPVIYLSFRMLTKDPRSLKVGDTELALITVGEVTAYGRPAWLRKELSKTGGRYTKKILDAMRVPGRPGVGRKSVGASFARR